MGFLNKLGKTMYGAVVNGAKSGVTSGILETLNNSFGIGSLGEVTQKQLFKTPNKLPNKFSSSMTKKQAISGHGALEHQKTAAGNRSYLYGKVYEVGYESANHKVVKTTNDDIHKFSVPDWGYADFINERAVFQKGLYSPFGDPGWFYFKIFFNFNTQYGLFGGIMNDESVWNSQNSAGKYLEMCNSSGRYTFSNLPDRIKTLHKFTNILSYINSNAPWFFKSVKNLNEAGKPYINDFSKEKSIEIECNCDAIDMRLSTILDMYRYVCYDNINNREIIPENLRKFDMSIIIFNTPIKYHNSAIATESGYHKHKTLNPENGDYSNVMSYKMFTFHNCEFSVDSIGSAVPGSISNEQPFKLGENSIKILYDRVYVHNSNEYFRYVFGDDGVYYDFNDPELNSYYEDKQSERYKAMQNLLENSYKFNGTGNSTNFKPLVDFSEGLMTHNLIRLSGTALGNIYGEQQLTGKPVKEYPDGAAIRIGDGAYYKAKLKHIHNRLNPITDIGANALLKLLGSNINANSQFGNLYGDIGINSEYYKNKLRNLKRGTLDRYYNSPEAEFLKRKQKWDNFTNDGKLDLEDLIL